MTHRLTAVTLLTVLLLVIPSCSRYPAYNIPDSEDTYNKAEKAYHDRPDLKPIDAPHNSDTTNVYVSKSQSITPDPLDFEILYELCTDFLAQFYPAAASVETGLVSVTWNDNSVELVVRHTQRTGATASDIQTTTFLIYQDNDTFYIKDWTTDEDHT